MTQYASYYHNPTIYKSDYDDFQYQLEKNRFLSFSTRPKRVEVTAELFNIDVEVKNLLNIMARKSSSNISSTTIENVFPGLTVKGQYNPRVNIIITCEYLHNTPTYSFVIYGINVILLSISNRHYPYNTVGSIKQGVSTYKSAFEKFFQQQNATVKSFFQQLLWKLI